MVHLGSSGLPMEDMGHHGWSQEDNTPTHVAIVIMVAVYCGYEGGNFIKSRWVDVHLLENLPEII